MPDTVMTTGEAARLLNVHTNTIRKWCDKGLIESYKTGPTGHLRIKKSSLVAYARQYGIPLQQNTSNE